MKKPKEPSGSCFSAIQISELDDFQALEQKLTESQKINFCQKRALQALLQLLAAMFKRLSKNLPNVKKSIFAKNALYKRGRQLLAAIF